MELESSPCSPQLEKVGTQQQRSSAAKNNINKWYKHRLTIAYDMRYVENPTDFTQKLLELTNEFIKMARYKINIQKSAVISLD